MSPPKGANGAATKAKPAKKLKDEAAPKRPITAYIAFASAARAEVQEELGTRSVPEVARELGRRWALLPADARAPYEQESKRAKERFEEEMRSYTPSDEFLARKAAAAAAILAPPVEAARADEGYLAFLLGSWQAEHAARPGLSPKEVQEAVWQRWLAGPGAGQAKPEVKKQKKVKDPNAPKKPPSSYLLYFMDQRAEVATGSPELGAGDVTRELARRWAALPPAEKATYEERADRSKEEYLEAKATYTEGLGGAAGD